MAPHSSTLAWKIPWTEEPGGLQSMESLRVGHNWATSLSLFTFMHWRRKWQPTPVFLPGESQGRGSLVGCRLWGRTVGHDWSDLAAAAASFESLYFCIYICICCLVAKPCPALLQPRGLWPTKFLCPWDFPGKNTGVGCHFLLQGIFLTQGLNPHLLHWQSDSLPLNHQGITYLYLHSLNYVTIMVQNT